LLTARGWTVLTAVNAMILCLLHFPCATALITIRRETGLKWAIVSFFLPLAFGVVLCLATTALAGVFTA
jgi:ferrous iron transport protein B